MSASTRGLWNRLSHSLELAHYWRSSERHETLGVGQPGAHGIWDGLTRFPSGLSEPPTVQSTALAGPRKVKRVLRSTSPSPEAQAALGIEHPDNARIFGLQETISIEHGLRR